MNRFPFAETGSFEPIDTVFAEFLQKPLIRKPIFPAHAFRQKLRLIVAALPLLLLDIILQLLHT